jgi:hypothetical protein
VNGDPRARIVAARRGPGGAMRPAAEFGGDAWMRED